MEKEKAIELLIQLAVFAQEKGILKLNEAAMVSQAIEVLTTKTEENKETIIGQFQHSTEVLKIK